MAGGSTPSAGYRRLAMAGVASTFGLVVLGGLVRVSGSGLGCGPAGSGLHGWPLCRGDVVPGADLNAVIEYAHRVLGSVVGLVILALAVLAWRSLRQRADILWASTGAAGLVVAQGLLGAGVVEFNLEAPLVAIHLGLAMLLLALTLYLWRASSPSGRSLVEGVRAPRGLASAAAVAVLLTIVAGGYMAGTENHGRTDRAQTVGAHYACGEQFPGCNGSFMPFGQGQLVDIHLLHRALMYIAAALVLALALVMLRRRPSPSSVRLTATSVGLLLLQILLGALNVWIAPQEPALILLHLTVGTLLWSTLVTSRLALSPVPGPAAARPTGSRPPEAVPA